MRTHHIAFVAVLLVGLAGLPATANQSPEAGPVRVEFTSVECELNCNDIPLTLKAPSQTEFLVDPDLFTVYTTTCLVTNGVRYVEVSLTGFGCSIGEIDCGSIPCNAFGIPPDGVPAPEDLPAGPVPATLASICEANADVFVNDNHVLGPSFVLVPCAISA